MGQAAPQNPAPWGTQGVRLQDAATGRLAANEAKRAVQLRRVLADLGPAFIKVGQALSARPDLLPQTYLDVRAPRCSRGLWA